MASAAVGTKRGFASLGDDDEESNTFFRHENSNNNNLRPQEITAFRTRESHQRRKPEISGTSKRESVV